MVNEVQQPDLRNQNGCIDIY